MLVFAVANRLDAQVNGSKIGGVCFRVDDNHEWKWTEYTGLFDAHGYKICIAMNPGILVPGYVDAIRFFLVGNGHEIADHTPNHTTFYFTSANAGKYTGMPGVDHVRGDTICLAIDRIDTVNSPSGELLMNVRGGFGYVLRNSIPGDLRIYPVLGIYSPEKKLFFRVTNQNLLGNSSKNPVFGLSTAWNESSSISLDSVRFRAVHFFDVHMKDKAVELLVKRSQELFRQYNLPVPTTWIQPGGSSPYLPPDQLQILGQASAATYPVTALKCFNEFNPLGDSQFAMQADFDLDTISVKDFKKLVATMMAKHFGLVGVTHLSSSADSQTAWEAYLNKTASMLAWCKQTGIPVMTQRALTSVLYNSVQDPHTNIFPALNVDRDGDGNPDGFGPADGTLSRNDGVPASGGLSFSLSTAGTLCRVRDLGGLEKNKNLFSIWTKGETGDSVDVIFTLHSKTGHVKIQRFPATTPLWTRYSTIVTIPDDVSTCDIAINAVVTGTSPVKISGVFMAKADEQVGLAGTVKCSGSNVPVSAVTVAISRKDVSPNVLTMLTSNANGVFTTAQTRLIPGSYSVSFSKAGGHPTVYANAADALTVTLHSIDAAAHPFSAIQKLAADVNNDGVINSADALQIMLRHVGLMTSFAKGDWVFISDTSDMDLEMSDNEDDAVAMAVGDVNGDAQPRSAYFAKVDGTPSVEAGAGPALKASANEVFEIPVRVKAPVNLGSLSLAFQYPIASAEFVGVRGPEGMVSAANDGVVKIAWFSAEHPMNLKENDVVVILRFNATSNVNAFSLTLDPNSQVTDAKGTILSGINLEIPAVDASIPTVFALGQNYPNPFNPSTTIAFSLPQSSNVSLKVINILGQEVATLLNGFQKAGNHTVRFDAGKLSSGVYLYRLQADNFVQTKKLVLLN